MGGTNRLGRLPKKLAAWEFSKSGTRRNKTMALILSALGNAFHCQQHSIPDQHASP